MLTFLNFIATLSARAGSANIFVYNSSVHIPDSFKLVEEFHGQFRIGGGKKGVLLDWRENEKKRRRRIAWNEACIDDLLKFILQSFYLSSHNALTVYLQVINGH